LDPALTEGAKQGWGENDEWGEEIGYIEQGHAEDSIDHFLVVSQQDVPQHDPLPLGGEPQIDYSKSYILTSKEYVASLEAKASRKQAVQEEAHLRKIAADENKENRRLQKLEKQKIRHGQKRGLPTKGTMSTRRK
jgi:hypothetical protein